MRKRTAVILFSLLFIFTILQGVLFGKEQRSGEGLFALPSGCGNKQGKCLIGKIPVRTKVILLGSRNSETCTATIENNFLAGFEAGDDFFLSLLNLEKCKSFSFDLAVTKPTLSSYRIIAPSDIQDKTIINKIDRIIRQQRHKFETDEGEHRCRLPQNMPKVIKLPSQAPGTFIVIYKNALASGDEIHLLYAGDKVKLIHGASTVKNIFELDNKYFIHYKFTCKIGCGWIGEFVVNFFDKNFEIVMFDDSWSEVLSIGV